MIQKQQIKSAMLPIAIIGGALFYKWMHYLYFLSPYLLFAMLFITYCKLDFKDFKPRRGHIYLIIIQIVLTALLYFAILPANRTVAEGIAMCSFMPTATAAPVITSMLGGSLAFVATFSLADNTLVAILGPVVLAAVGEHPEISLLQSSMMIMSKVAPLLILPIASALLLRKFVPKFHKEIVSHQEWSFYIWAVSLFIIVGNCVSFTINHWSADAVYSIIAMFFGALIVCLIQFAIGRRIGKYIAVANCQEDTHRLQVSSAQGLMQKNTVLGVWIALAFLNPMSSVAPAAYILWQNCLNSFQIWKYQSKKQNHYA